MERGINEYMGLLSTSGYKYRARTDAVLFGWGWLKVARA